MGDDSSIGTEVLRDAAEDRDLAVVDTDVVLGVQPRDRRADAAGDHEHADDPRDEDPPAPTRLGFAPRAPRRPRRARSGLGQAGGAGGRPVVGGRGVVARQGRGTDDGGVRRRSLAVRDVVQLDDVREHDRDVVAAARAQRELDQPVGARVDVVDRGHRLFDGLGADEPRQAVRAEQPAVAGPSLAHRQVGGDVGVEVAEHPHDDRALRVHLGLLGRDPPDVDQVLHERVVGGDLGEDLVAHQVPARVAQVHHRELVAGAQDRQHGRAHARELRVGLAAAG